MDRRRRHVCGPGPWLARVRPDSETPRLETAKGCHEIIDIAGRRRLTGFEVALNAQSGEEGEHHLGNCGSSHLGLFGFDVHGKKALQQRPILCHDSIGFIRKDRELPHGVDGKTSLLLPLIERTILEKSLDVFPAQRLLGQKSPLSLALKIVPQARHKKIFLVSKLRIEPRLVHACSSFQFLNTRVRKPVLPKDRHRLFQNLLSAKALWTTHSHIISDKELNSSISLHPRHTLVIV